MRTLSRSFGLVLLLLGACDCGSAATTRGTTATAPAPTTSPPSATTVETTTAPRDPPAPRVVRVLVPAADGMHEHTVDLAAGTLEGCVRASDGTCASMGRRDGAWFPDDWRATIARLAVASRDASCPSATGATVHIEIDGAASDVVVPPYPEDRDYFPPADGALHECAPIELARTVQTYLAWE